jgi:hypothetical protein
MYRCLGLVAAIIVYVIVAVAAWAAPGQGGDDWYILAAVLCSCSRSEITLEINVFELSTW